MNSAGNKNRLRNDLILILALLILAGAFWLLVSSRGAKDGFVVVRVDGVETERHALTENGTYPLNGGTNVLVIRDGAAWMEEADCPDKICISQGRISREGQAIICLPNRVTVTVVGGSQPGVDIVVGKKLTVMALTIALAMVLSFLESQIPAFVAIPGVKVGLANIAVVFALYKLGWKEAAGISLIRVLLISVLFGNFASLFYSLAGAVLSLLGMILLKHSEKFSAVAVSVAGGVLHNVGQILMACILLETDIIRYYLPFLILSGVLAGVVIGVVSAIMVQRIKLEI